MCRGGLFCSYARMSPPLFNLLRGSSGFEKKKTLFSFCFGINVGRSLIVDVKLCRSITAILSYVQMWETRSRLLMLCNWFLLLSLLMWTVSLFRDLQTAGYVFDAPWLAWRIWIRAVMLLLSFYATVWFMKYSVCNIPWTVWIVMLSHGTPFSERCIYCL